MATRPSGPPATFVARAKFVHMSSFKVREVINIIRGKHIDEARRILAFTPKLASRTVSKVLESAVATAEHDYQVPQDELFVKRAWADEGMTIKRFRARAQGRGYRIRKRTCHINLELERRVKLAPTPRPGRGGGRLRASRRPEEASATPPKGRAGAGSGQSRKAKS